MKAEMKKKDKILADLAKEYVEMGEECVKIGNQQAAMANFEKAIRISPECVDAMIGKARLLLEEHQLRKALTVVNKVLKIQPHKMKNIYWHAKVLFAMNRYDEAVNDLERCTSLNPDSISAHLLYGDVLSAMGDDVNAAIHYAIADRLKKNKSNEE